MKKLVIALMIAMFVVTSSTTVYADDHNKGHRQNKEHQDKNRGRNYGKDHYRIYKNRRGDQYKKNRRRDDDRFREDEHRDRDHYRRDRDSRDGHRHHKHRSVNPWSLLDTYYLYDREFYHYTPRFYDDYDEFYSHSDPNKAATDREEKHRKAAVKYKDCLDERGVDIRRGIPPEKAKDCTELNPMNIDWK